MINHSIDNSTEIHVDALDLINKFSDYSKKADLNIDTILHEQITDPVIQKVRKWVKLGQEPDDNYKIKQSKAFQSYKNNFKLLFLDPTYDILCFNEPTSTPGQTQVKICLPLTLILKCFELAHSHPLSGHMGIGKTFDNVRRFFFWPGRYKWIAMLIADCLNCQKNKSKRHDLNDALLEV